MTFKGVIIGYIDVLGPRTNMTGHYDKKNDVLALRNLWEFFARMDETSATGHEAFIRTLICNKVHKFHHLYSTNSEFLVGILGYFSPYFSTLDPERKVQTGASILTDYWNSHSTKVKQGLAVVDHDHVERSQAYTMEAWMDFILGHTWDRRFFISSSKTMGLAAQEVIKSDLICIPLGCCHPIIVRRVENHYINLGEAYVDGYMDGEGMDLLDRGEMNLEEFTL
jgi:hypothetical protein